jgi:hypothetical protein
MTPPVSVEGEEKGMLSGLKRWGGCTARGTQRMDRDQEQLLVRAMTHRLR